MYKITIEKIETVEVTRKGEWGVIEKRPYTQKEMDDKYNPEDYKGKLKDVLGYKDSFKSKEEVKMLILEQSIKELELNKVLIAVNNIGD